MATDIFEKFEEERDLLLNTYRNAQMNGNLHVAKYSLDELYNCCFNYYMGLGEVVSNLERLKEKFPGNINSIESRIYSITRHRSYLAKNMNDLAFELADLEWRK